MVQKTKKSKSVKSSSSQSIPKLQDGGSKPKPVKVIDKELTQSIKGYGMDAIRKAQAKQREENLLNEAMRQQKIKRNPVSDNTKYIIPKPIGYKKGGTVTSKKKK